MQVYLKILQKLFANARICAILDLLDNRRDAVWTRNFFVRHIQIFAGILTDFKKIWMRPGGKRPVQAVPIRLSNRSNARNTPALAGLTGGSNDDHAS
jgi:hypothetical protein